MKMRNVETINNNYTNFSLKSFTSYIMKKTVQFNYIQFSQATVRQVSKKYNLRS